MDDLNLIRLLVRLRTRDRVPEESLAQLGATDLRARPEATLAAIVRGWHEFRANGYAEADIYREIETRRSREYGAEPLPSDLKLPKNQASAFFGTPLVAHLVQMGVDTVVITGCTTSGCVRASTLDAMCHGFRPMVLSDCVGDRAEGPHAASLFDMGQKYADILTRDEAFAELDRLAVAA